METQFCWILRELVDLLTEECEDFMLPPTPQATSPTRSDRQVGFLDRNFWGGVGLYSYTLGVAPHPGCQ